MRRLLTLAVTVLVTASVTAQASAQTAPRDSVTGSAFVVLTLLPNFTIGVNFDFDAFSGPSGEDPGGTVDWSFGTEPVTCLSVQGNHAVIGIPGALTGLPALIYVADNDGGTGDTVGFMAISAPATTCPAPGGHEDSAIFTGDLTVVDAPALPTSKNQCKNGGWKTFGVFKNQGDCVSFLAG